MLSHEERMHRAKKRRKIFITAVLIAAGVFILIAVVLVVLSAVNTHIQERRLLEAEAAAEEARGTLIFPDPDWELNIFEDAYYMGLDRGVWVNDGSTRTVITEDNRERHLPEIQFMFDVVQLIINGDSHAYADIFTDDYWNDPRHRDVWWALLEEGYDAFTMQRLWDIEIAIIDRIETQTEIITDISLTYRLHRNDGTFRNDLPSSRYSSEQGTRPMLYRLVRGTDGEIRVSHRFVYRVQG